MNITRALDTITLTERQVNDALALAIKQVTGRTFDRVTDVKVFDCVELGAPKQKLLNITVTLKDAE